MTRLTIAIPSKGRLKDNAEAFFQGCGFKLRQKGGARGYSAELKGLDEAEVILLSAREIALGLIEGAFHIGITGEDLLHDLSADIASDVHTLKRLGFGHADVVVAAPQAWLDVSNMADLEAASALFRARHGRRMKVATKYLSLTRRHFAAHSVGDYRLVESAGATEAAPASGSAELIVDITSTGATLRANGLKVLEDGVILQSQAVLAGALKATWSDGVKQTLRAFLDSVEARSAGEARVVLTTHAPVEAETLLSDERVQQLSAQVLLCPRGASTQLSRRLVAEGLGPVSVHKPEFIFESKNDTCDRFLEKV